MSQIGKKCFYASFGLHFLLVVVVICGSAFLTVRDKPDNAKLVKLYKPSDLTDFLKSGGGPLANAVPPTRPPSATPPPPIPEVVAHPAPKPADEPVVKPAPEPPPQVKPTPPKIEHRTPRPPEVAAVKPTPNKRPVRHAVDKDKPEPKPEPKVKPVVKEALSDDDLKPVTHTTKSITKSNPKPKPERHSEEIVRPTAPVTPPGPDPVEVWDKQRREAIQTAMTTIGHNSSAPITPVDIPLSVGGDGGQEQTNYRDLVFSKYNAAWEPPPELEDSRASTLVTITVAPDGRIIERRIVRPSNNRMMDRSIQATLNKVTFIEPFPPGANGRPRTYMINFNLQTKRSAG